MRSLHHWFPYCSEGSSAAPAQSTSTPSIEAAPATSSSSTIDASGWVDAPQVQRVTIGSRFAARVADLGDEEFDEGATQRADIEAEEAKYVHYSQPPM